MSAPICPVHKIPMVKKTAKTGKNAGHEFWGCPKWQECHQSKPIIESSSKSAPNKTTYNNKPRTGLPWGSAAPLCPAHHTTMVMRTSKKAKNLGHPFWGCRQHPDCNETISILAPSCPTCGTEMVVRVAQQGGFEGKSFWACPKLHCKGLIDINGKIESKGKFTQDPPQQQPSVTVPGPRPPQPTRTASATAPTKPTSPQPTRKAEAGQSNATQRKASPRLAEPDPYAELLTREFKAREYRQGYEAHFFQNLAVPSQILKELNLFPEHREKLQRFSGWRVDLPPATMLPEQLDRDILAGIIKILLRGRITLPSPYAEDELEKRYGEPKSLSLLADPSFLFSQEPVSESSGWWFDGQGPNSPERIFHDEVLPRIHPSGRLCAIPQVFLRCLVRPEEVKEIASQQRVDFLLTNGANAVIIELDDSTHAGHDSRDRLRTIQAKKGGFPTLRIPSNILMGSPDSVATALQEQLRGFPLISTNRGDGTRLMVMAQLLHQLEISIVMALMKGVLAPGNAICLVDGKSMGLDVEETRLLCQTLELDLSDMIQNYACLFEGSPEFKIRVDPHGEEGNAHGVVFTKDGTLNPPIPAVLIRNTFLPFRISVVVPAAGQNLDIHPNSDNIRYFLSHIFRKDDFLEGQYETIDRALRGLDTVVLLPTGAGKSIAFQLSAFLLPGVALVVSPLVSLMDDQLDNLQRVGVDSVLAISSQIRNPETKTKLIAAFGRQEYLLAYVTPERLQTEQFRDVLRKLGLSTLIPLVAIDEAHCVSEWGHSFRTSYLNIGRVSRDYCANGDRPPCIIALTGTASSAVLKDVQRELQMPLIDSVITPTSFDRKELHYHIDLCHSDAKAPSLHRLLKSAIPEVFGIDQQVIYSGHDKDAVCGVVFCPHVDGPHGIIEIRDGIKQNVGISPEIYGGRVPDGLDEVRWNTLKKKVADDFKNNRVNLLCTTKAFGMGIDKPNIRYTIHWGLPPSIESYYQEVGRAGRNRMDSYSYVMASMEDEDGYDQLFDMDADHGKLVLVKKSSGDDINRVMRLHAKSFVGVKQELELVAKVLKLLKIAKVGTPSRRSFAVNQSEKDQHEKALHRLVVLGVVSDYTLDYSTNEFGVQVSGISYDDIIENFKSYVRGYNVSRVGRELEKTGGLKRDAYDKFVMAMCRILLEFIYDTVEKGRRKALLEMWGLAKEAARSDDQDATIRERILRYLESTFTPLIEEILSSEDLGFAAIMELVDGREMDTGELAGGIRSHKDSSAVRGQAARYLESTPDHPGLLFLRSLAEVFCRNYDHKTVTGNFFAALDSLRTRYQADRLKLDQFLVWILARIRQRDSDIYEECVIRTLETTDDLAFSSKLIRSGEFPPTSLYYPLTHQLAHLIGLVKEKYSIDNQ